MTKHLPSNSCRLVNLVIDEELAFILVLRTVLKCLNFSSYDVTIYNQKAFPVNLKTQIMIRWGFREDICKTLTIYDIIIISSRAESGNFSGSFVVSISNAKTTGSIGSINVG